MRIYVELTDKEKELTEKMFAAANINTDLNNHKIASMTYNNCFISSCSEVGYRVDIHAQEELTSKVLEWATESLDKIKILATALLSGYKGLVAMIGLPKIFIDGVYINNNNLNETKNGD